MQGVRVDLVEPLLHRRVEGITTRHLLPQAVVDDVGGGVPADEDVEHLGQVPGPLVPVALQTLDPRRVEDSGAQDDPGLLRGGACGDPGRIGGVTHERHRCLTAHRRRSDDEPAVVVVEVGAAEHVVLAGVLVLDGDVHPRQRSGESLGLHVPEHPLAVGVGGGRDVGPTQIGLVLPRLGLDEFLHTGAVSAGWATEDPQCRLATSLLDVDPASDHVGDVGLDVGTQHVVVAILRQGGDHPNRPVNHLDEVGEGVPEQPGDARGDVDARTSQFIRVDDLQPADKA